MEVKIHRRVLKRIERFPEYVKADIFETLELLERWPFIIADIKKLDDGVYRIRKGSYRILFQTHKARDLILVFEIEIRGSVSYAKS